jgi:hypothetical protein
LDLEAAVRNMGFCAQGGNDVLLNPKNNQYFC